MPGLVTFAMVVYAVGVAIGLLMVDGSRAVRLGLALMWPVGPIAFIVTLAILIGAAAIAFPLFGVLVAAAAIGWWMVN